jgi:hypothetical protein
MTHTEERYDLDIASELRASDKLIGKKSIFHKKPGTSEKTPYEELFFKKGSISDYDLIAKYIVNAGIELPMSVLQYFEKLKQIKNSKGGIEYVDVITPEVKSKIMHEMVTQHFYNWSWVDDPKRKIKETREFHHVKFKFYDQLAAEITLNAHHAADVKKAIVYDTRSYPHDIHMGMYNGYGGNDWRDGPGVENSRKSESLGGPVYNVVDDE